MKNFKMYYEKQLASYTIYLVRHKKKVGGAKKLNLFSKSASYQEWPLPLLVLKTKAIPKSIKLHRLYRDVN